MFPFLFVPKPGEDDIDIVGLPFPIGVPVFLEARNREEAQRVVETLYPTGVEVVGTPYLVEVLGIIVTLNDSTSSLN